MDERPRGHGDREVATPAEWGRKQKALRWEKRKAAEGRAREVLRLEGALENLPEFRVPGRQGGSINGQMRSGQAEKSFNRGR